MIFKLSLLTSFLFLLAISPPANSFRNRTSFENPRGTGDPAVNVIILTDESIHRICSQTGYPPLCQQTLSEFEGKPLFPKPLGNITEMARKHAKSTTKKIYGLYDTIKDKKAALKTRYNRCLKKYEGAMTLINKAKKYLDRGDPRGVLLYAGQAANLVYECDQDLHKRPKEPSNISKDNDKFRDIVSIIYVVCNMLSAGN
ncbi:pectinesterase inhibitor [Phtheirospermum japonicum]|uniref:Pectinesterase inhibitor n=1 Tax=Phtheirospermum japonicum TaxID=374723 RepID=A0A830CW14_9LAMI|nr:pectinesterase inhibitor [Phtheirospermum japonicum]